MSHFSSGSLSLFMKSVMCFFSSCSNNVAFSSGIPQSLNTSSSSFLICSLGACMIEFIGLDVSCDFWNVHVVGERSKFEANV